MATLSKAALLLKQLTVFADNQIQNFREVTFRTLIQDLADSFVNAKDLNVRMVKGATYPVPFTDSLGLIPPVYRILNMLAVARVGLSAADAAVAGEANYGQYPAITYQLLRDSAGTVDALVDEDPNTTATAKARWVQISGLPAAIVDSFPPFVPEDRTPSYKAGDRFSYTFPSGEKRLFEVRFDIPNYVNPTPTGADNDPNYAPYAPLSAAAAYVAGEGIDITGQVISVTSTGGAPQWVAGPQKEGALVYDLGVVYRVKQNIANSQSAPAGNGANYERVPLAVLSTTGQSTAAPMSQKATTDALAAKVATAASVTSGGVTTAYATAQQAADFSPLGVPIVLRGAQGALALYASETIDAYTASFGSNELSVGFPPTSTVQNTRIVGFSHAGRIVLIPQITAAGNVYTLEDVNLSGAARIEVFLLQSGAFQGAKDIVNLTRIRGTKTVISQAGTSPASLGTGLIVFQGRSDFNQRQLIINERDCDLSNEVGAVYGGYLTRNSIINRLGTSRAVAAAGFPFQELFSLDRGVYVPLTDAEIINDQRAAAGSGAGIDRRDLVTISGYRTNTLVLEGHHQLSNPKLGPNVGSISAQVITTDTGTATGYSAPHTGTVTQVFAAVNADLTAIAAAPGVLVYVRFITAPVTAADETHLLLTVSA